MPRPSVTNEYVLRINARSEGDVRRFCEVRVKGAKEVYVFQPRKGGSTKISYHASGQKHVKVGNGPALYAQRLDPPEWVELEESCWEQSFENFASLLPYRNDEPAGDVFEIELPTFPDDAVLIAQVSVGRFFERPSWAEDGVTLTTLQQKVFAVSTLQSSLTICVRTLKLQHVGNGT